MDFVHVMQYGPDTSVHVSVHRDGDIRFHEDVSEESLDRLEGVLERDHTPIGMTAFHQNWLVFIVSPDDEGGD